MDPSPNIREERASFADTDLAGALGLHFSTAESSSLIKLNSDSVCFMTMFEACKGRSYYFLKAWGSFLALRRTTS